MTAVRVALVLSLMAALRPQDPPPTPLQTSLNDLEPNGPWNYNDLGAGFAEARRTGKPLLIVFR